MNIFKAKAGKWIACRFPCVRPNLRGQRMVVRLAKGEDYTVTIQGASPGLYNEDLAPATDFGRRARREIRTATELGRIFTPRTAS